tara:strand:- start:2689 stop:6480 length:3792 start_codon:yes stop_codon:yes gene_type:complete
MPSQEIQEILDSSLPNVNIGIVTLENSGGEFTYKNNPHIDYKNEGLTVKRSDTQAMKVTVGLTVKDAVTDSALSYWFKNRDIVDLLDVRITLSTNPETTNYILQSNRSLNYDSKIIIGAIPLKTALAEQGFRNRVTKVDSDGNRIHYFSFDYSLEIDNNIPYLAVFSCCRIDLDALFKQAPSTLQIQTDIVDELPDDLLAGNLSYNVIIEGGNVLSTMPVFVEEESGTLWTGPIHQMPNGRWMTDAIHSDSSKYLSRRNLPNTRIQDYRISSYIDKREIEIQQAQQKISKVISRSVTSQNVENQKPKSYFSDISYSRDNLGQARFFFSMDYNKIIEDYTLFGGLLKKKGLIDPSNIALNYCRISSLKIFRRRIHGSAETGSKPYLVASTINGDTFVPLDPASPPSNFDCNQVDQLIAFTSEEDGVLKTNEYFKINDFTPVTIMPSIGFPIGAIPPVSSLSTLPGQLPTNFANKTVIGTIEELTGIRLNDAEGIRHISGIDKSMPQVTDGYYQYRIEMEIIDKTDEYILSQLRDLQSAKDYLQFYLNEITKPGQEASYTWKVDPHIDYEQEGKTVSRKNKITLDYRRIRNSINTYLQMLFLFSKETTSATYDPSRPSNGDALRDQLISLVNPRTPNGTSAIIGLMEVLINKTFDILKIKELNTLTKLSNNNTTLAARQPSTLMNYSKPTISFQIKNTFVNYFNSNVDRTSSFDFLGLQENSLNMGIKKMSETEFLNRISQETNRLFRNPQDSLTFAINGQEFNTGDNLQFTDFSYISPARVNMAHGKSLQIVGSSPTNDAGAYVDAAVGDALGGVATEESPPASSPGEPAASTVVTTKMVTLGVVVEPAFAFTTLTLVDGLTDPVNKDNQICPVESANASANPFSMFMRLLEEINPNSYQFGGPYETTGQAIINEDRALVAQTIRDASTFFSPNNPSGPASNFQKNYSIWTPSFLFRGAPHANDLSPSQGWISTTPNHMKVLTKQEILPTNIREVIGRTSTSVSSQSEVNIKFFKLDAIEIMTGYQEDQLTKPQWQPLTRQIYNQALGGTLICRLSPYQNKVFGVTRDLQSEFPTIDTFFLLEPRTAQAALEIFDLPPGFNANAFSPSNFGSLFGDLPGVDSSTFYIEPPASSQDIRSIYGGVRSTTEITTEIMQEVFYDPPPASPDTGEFSQEDATTLRSRRAARDAARRNAAEHQREQDRRRDAESDQREAGVYADRLAQEEQDRRRDAESDQREAERDEDDRLRREANARRQQRQTDREQG